MEKRKYYVSVQSGTVMLHEGDAAYEFEIEATPDELDRLQELLEMKAEFDNDTFTRAHAPGIPYHLDVENDRYDFALREIYALIGELGTTETRQLIAGMDLPHLGDWKQPEQ